MTIRGESASTSAAAQAAAGRLLPEPERDHSGYRQYDAQAAVDLIKIRTLADAGHLVGVGMNWQGPFQDE